ncbi:MAG: uroporphyrinogen-III C-methyltransferase [Candidatus Latescibacterota bacterium]
MVYLVGAGPGDPGLATVKALDLVRRADVILYDRLIDPQLLFEARSDCTLVDVGKSSGDHSVPQREITELLVEYGRKELEVVRLKGGDPFLFGRGGEEAERLAEEKIPFAVVPGVSALTAVTAYAGIPLTHRGYSSSVGAATGHAADGKTPDSVNWRNLAAGVDTIVVFMGVGNLDSITSELMNGGRSPETPAAILEHGTTPAQRIVTGALGNIAQKAREEKVSPPALLIVGETVPLAAKLGWYRPGPLAGLRIGVTRPRAQSRALSGRLAALGAEPVLMPTIEIVETPDNPEVRKALDRLDLYDYLVFSSANGVNAFFRALRGTGRDSRALAGKTVAAIGPATAEALAGCGVKADITAESFIAEGLLEAVLEAANVTGMRFLIIRSDIGRNTLAEGLRNAGAVVEEAVFYSTRPAEIAPFVLDRIRRGDIAIITFTSASTVHGFFQGMPPETPGPDVLLASIGPQTSQAITEYGRQADIEAKEYTAGGLAQAILSWKEKHTVRNPESFSAV